MKPTVLHVVETCLPRTQVFIYKYIAGHQEWQPVILCRYRAHEAEFPLPRVHLIPAPDTKRALAWWWASAVEAVTGRSPWHRKAERLLRGVRPGVIHAHFGQLGYAMLPVKRRLGVPLITTFYGYDMSVLPRRPRWRRRFARLFREGDLFLVEGPHMRECLIRAGAPAEKVEIQRIAINPESYPPWRPAPGDPTGLFVGRFIEKKGLLDALKAFHLAREEVPALRLRIIGDGEERASAERFTVENGLESVVTFLGMKPHHEVVDELSRAHVLIHPSVTAANGDSEGGAPTVLLEAQAIGTPVVSTRHADIPNVTTTRGGVILVPERDPEALARGLSAALRAGVPTDRDFVRSYHDVNREVCRLEERYSRLIRGPRN